MLGKGTRTAPATAPAGFTMLPGRGVTAQVEGRALLAGNPQLLTEHGVPMEETPEAQRRREEGCTLTYVAVDGQFAGTIALSDALREESAAMVAQLTGLGVTPVLLTGDHENAARAIAGRLGIGEVRANCLPRG